MKQRASELLNKRLLALLLPSNMPSTAAKARRVKNDGVEYEGVTGSDGKGLS